MATTCNYTLNDIVHLDTVMGYYAGDPLALNNAVHIAENILFNLGDMFYLLEEGRAALINKNYLEFGTVIGHLTTDLFYINPYDGLDVWNDANSKVIENTGSIASSKKVPSSFYQPLKVTSTFLLQGKKDKREAKNSVLQGSTEEFER